MRKTISFLIISLFLFACGSDDDSGASTNSTNNNSIIGTWVNTSIIEDNEEVSTICDRQEFYVFNTDNSFTFQLFDEIEDVNQDGTVTVTDCREGELLNGTYSLDNNNLTFQFGPDDTETAIFSFDQENLILSFGNDTEIYTRR